ncbi:shikimate kinase AroK [Motiliproteus sp. MSK22-1]|uniref:shikimate kinase AroK n=1 Tax=Motiliproteus sp. MSK22-1 TaxID=1897630 RepID=UPI0021014B71|nr:shikimate kinase AroK [Motiliproteus sp. MSK22-1]
MNIFLIGPMGAGKSTIGRLLSKELYLEFKDSDKEVEDRAGADIPWIFDVEGEDGFRRRESAAINDLSSLSGLVLATGGGAILREENRKYLQSRGTVIYLHASVEQQIERTAKDRNRPLLQADNPARVLSDLMAIRDPIYQECCDYLVKTDGRRPRAVVREILQYLDK